MLSTKDALKLRELHFVGFYGPKHLTKHFDVSMHHMYCILKRKGIYKDIPDLITDEQYQRYYMNKSMQGHKLYKYEEE